MSSTYPSPILQPTNSSNSSVEPSVNKFALVTCGVLFFCTFPYWFGDSSSRASLVNVLLMRNGLLNETLSFWGHFLLTAAWLTLFYRAGASQWTGWRISSIPKVTGLFYHSQKPTTWAIRVIIGLLLALLAYKIYSTLLEFAGGGALPKAQVLSVLLLAAFLLLIWDVRYINPQPLYARGLITGRNRSLWVNILPTQIVYMAQFSNGVQTWARKPVGFADISHADVYLFDTDYLSHKLHNASTAKSLLGDIKYDLTLRPVFSNFPANLTTEELHNIHSRLATEVDITTEISAALDRESLNRTVQQYLDAVSNAYTKAGTSIHDNINYNFFNNFDKLKSSIDFSGLERECQARIKEHIARIMTVDNAFDLAEFIITNVQLPDGEIKKTLDDIRVRSATAATQHGDIEMEQAKAIINASVQPGVNGKRIATDLVESMGVLKEGASGTSPEAAIFAQPEQQNSFKQIMQQDLDKVFSIILDPDQRQLGHNAVAESLNTSTTLFTTRNISPDLFVQRFMKKMEDEKQVRSDEALRQLVRDTLSEFLNKKV